MSAPRSTGIAIEEGCLDIGDCISEITDETLVELGTEALPMLRAITMLIILTLTGRT